MPCLHPIRIKNPSKEVKFGSTKYYLYVPCGKCSECQRCKAAEWQLRCYYEARQCFENGGFILFDTLTYAPKNRPFLHHHDSNLLHTKYDALCFNRQDIRLFMVRLRSELTRLGYDVKHSLKYFLSSEYGTDDLHDHAPHYHVCFYVNFDIDPFELSALIDKCWYLGRTDGINYKGRSYVLTKRLFSSRYNPDLVHLQSVLMYVCKYIMKDSEFEKRVRSNIESLLLDSFGDNWQKSEHAKNYYKSLVRNAFQFHLQSKHFGECALKYLDPEEVCDSGQMFMPDRKLIKRFIQTPIYFQRKLMYELTNDFRGQKVWRLSDKGKSIKADKLAESISSFEMKVSAWFDHLSPSEKLTYYPYGTFNSVLFSQYVHLFKGVVMSPDVIHNLGKINNPWDGDFLHNWIYNLLFSDKLDTMYHYSSKKDIDYLGCACIVPHYYGDFENPRNFDKVVGISENTFEKYIISDSTSPYFRGYDRIFNLYTSWLCTYTKNKQSSFEETQLLTKKFKALCTK